MVDVVAVPNRLENRIGKPQHQDVLHRLLAEVVVDAIDLLFVEDAVQRVVELVGTSGIAAERFFDHDPPGAIFFVGQSTSTQPRNGFFIKLGSRGQIIDPRGGV